MKTVGSLLLEARMSKGLSLGDIEKATKIRQRFLVSIEKDDFDALPSPSYAKGFVRNYAEYLGLSPEKMMAFFRRQMEIPSRATILPKGIVDPLNTSFFTLTPGKFLLMLSFGLLVVFFVYLGRQYVQIQQPPSLRIDAPLENAVFTEKKIAIEGITDSDATLTINELSSIVRDDGRFYEQISLDPGQNTITISATSRFGKTITVQRVVQLTE